MLCSDDNEQKVTRMQPVYDFSIPLPSALILTRLCVTLIEKRDTHEVNEWICHQVVAAVLHI